MSQHYEFSRNYSSNQKSTRLNDNNDTVKNVYAKPFDKSNQSVNKNVYAKPFDKSNQSVNTVKTVYAKPLESKSIEPRTVIATGPVYRSNGSQVMQVYAVDYNAPQKKPTVLPVVSALKTKMDLQIKTKNVFNKIMSEACYPDVILEQLLAEFWGNKKIDHRTGTLIAHLQPILINHYDESNENRYKELSSQKFQDEVRNYYEKYDLETVFRNDRDNELWRIFLYPQ